jgi:hypothetical protein
MISISGGSPQIPLLASEDSCLRLVSFNELARNIRKASELGIGDEQGEILTRLNPRTWLPRQSAKPSDWGAPIPPYPSKQGSRSMPSNSFPFICQAKHKPFLQDHSRSLVSRKLPPGWNFFEKVDKKETVADAAAAERERDALVVCGRIPNAGAFSTRKRYLGII